MGLFPWSWGSEECIFFSEQESIDGPVYMDLFNLHIRPFLDRHPGSIWQQDNASPHVTPATLDMLRAFHRLTFWPPNSPDYSPIEFVWMAMKKALYGITWTSLDELMRAVRDEWRRQTSMDLFRSHCKRALENMERSAQCGYQTVH